MKTRDGQKLTQVAMDGIIADTKVILESTLKRVQKEVLERVSGLGVMEDEGIEELKAIFSKLMSQL